MFGNLFSVVLASVVVVVRRATSDEECANRTANSRTILKSSDSLIHVSIPFLAIILHSLSFTISARGKNNPPPPFCSQSIITIF